MASDDIVMDTRGRGHDLQTPDITALRLPNATLTDEANPGVNAFQMGEDASGTLKPQHLTTADQTGTGAGADMGLNPGTAAGVNQPGAQLALAGGTSTGTGAPGEIVFTHGHTGSSGSSPNLGAPRWHMGSLAGIPVLYPDVTETNYLGFANGRLASAYAVNVVTGTAAGAPGVLELRSPNGTRFNVTVSNAGVLAAVAL